MHSMLKAAAVATLVVFPSMALAEDAVTPPAAGPIIAEDADRVFALSESAAVPSTFVRAHTVGRGSNTAQAFRIDQSVELVPLQHLSLRVTAEWSTNAGFKPSAQAKYQFLNQQSHGVNMAVGVKYKTEGFDPSGSEVEGILAAGRSFGRMLATANLVFGQGVGEAHDQDLEGHLSGGYQISDQLLAGVSARYKFALTEAAEGSARPMELIAGPVVAYNMGWVDASLQGGVYVPKGDVPVGGIAILGLNFSF